MTKGRLEAFSDGVIAVIITIMVLELKLPQGTQLSALRPLIPVFLSYTLSFIYVGIYWTNHHHLLQAAEHITGGILWANLHFLFWLSLAPFASAWMGANPLAPFPVFSYGVILLFSAVGYTILTRALIAHHGPDSLLGRSIGIDRKGLVSLAIYLFALSVAFFKPTVSCACYVIVAFLWLIPDRRIEDALKASHPHPATD